MATFAQNMHVFVTKSTRFVTGSTPSCVLFM